MTRTVVVTGANGGIGQATVVELASAGFDVVGTVRPPDVEAKAAEVRAAAAAAGVTVRVAELDVDDADACRRVVAAEAPWGLVNNAGFVAAGPVSETAEAVAREQLETLVLSPLRLARLASGPMRDAGGGRIVNVSSIVADVSVPLIGWYQAAKRALEGVTDALRVELHGDGIAVVLVAPGMVRTPIWDDARARLDRPTRFGPAAGRWRALTRLVTPAMSSPASVAAAIRTALEADRPRARYLVGLDAQVLTRAARLLPDRVTDAAARALLRLDAR